MATSASAEQVGLWLFDASGEPKSGASQRFDEVSDAQAAFVKASKFGSAAYSDDVPDVMSAGSTAIDIKAARSLDVMPTDRFSLGRTGQLTIEFWYKPRLADTIRAILSYGGGQPNGFGIAQRPPVDGRFAIEAVFTDDVGRSHALHTMPIFAAGDAWRHVAVAVNTQTGLAYLFVDGQVQGQVTGWNRHVFKPAAYPLRLGATSNDTFAGDFLLDELRISDISLAAGAGTGQDELAFAASLSNPDSSE